MSRKDKKTAVVDDLIKIHNISGKSDGDVEAALKRLAKNYDVLNRYRHRVWTSEHRTHLKLGDMDIVYLVKEAPSNNELVFSLRSICENVPHRDVWFVGGKPKGTRPDHHIKIVQTSPVKWQNTSQLLRTACLNDEISDEFMLFNDDFFVLQPITELPYYSDGDLNRRIEELEERNNAGSKYISQLRNTYMMLYGKCLPTQNYALHVPMIINKYEMLETFDAFPKGLMWRSIYGNHHQKPTEYMQDVKIYDRSEDIPDGAVFVSTDDDTFDAGIVGVKIRKQFPDKCRYE